MRLGLYLDMRNPPRWRRPWADHYARWLELVEEADRLGVDSVWLSEHHFFEDGYLSQPLAFAAAIAARTRRARIGTAVMLPALKHAAQLAEEAALVDVLSNGRLDLGVGAGYRVPEFEAFGADIRSGTTWSRPRVARGARAVGARARRPGPGAGAGAVVGRLLRPAWRPPRRPAGHGPARGDPRAGAGVPRRPGGGRPPGVGGPVRAAVEHRARRRPRCRVAADPGAPRVRVGLVRAVPGRGHRATPAAAGRPRADAQRGLGHGGARRVLHGADARAMRRSSSAGW